jgi:DNA (cytosine-5)-methyltransferase 1
MRTVALCEIEAFAIANLVAKMEAGLMDPAPIWTDLKTFPWEEFRDKVDVLSGGYPCQPFSAAGKRLGTDDPRHLWPYIASGIRLLRPKLCFFENVEGHITLGLREVVGELEELGYETAWGIFSAAEVGASHQRKRVFILAYRKCEGLERWISRLQSTSNRNGPSNDTWKSSNSMVNSINNDECNVSRIECKSEKQSIISISSGNVADTNNSRSWENQLLSELWSVGAEQSSRGSRIQCDQREIGKITTWPSRPGESQYKWEPPRVIGKTQPTLGGDSHGPAGGLDYAELCVTCDNRTDELRLLGNGVVPATAELAFKILLNELH